MRIRLLLAIVMAVSLTAAACSSSSAEISTATTTPDDAGAVAQDEPTTTITMAVPEADEEEDDAPAGSTLDAYLTAVINTAADWGDCGAKVEQDLNDAQPEEPTEEQLLEYAIAYVGGHIECWQGEHDAIVALEPSAEAAAAHADLVESRASHLMALRTAFDNAEIADDYFRLLFEPPPDVIAAYVVWGDACVALEAVAKSNSVDAELNCPVPPPGAVTPVTVFVDASEWLVEPEGVLQDEGSGVEITIVNSDDAPHRPVMIFLFSGSSSPLPIVDGVLDLSRCNVVSNEEDPSPPPAYFGCEYPTSLGDNVRAVEELAPGDSVQVMVGSGGGTLVVLDYLPGAYEAGQFMVLEVLPFE